MRLLTVWRFRVRERENRAVPSGPVSPARPQHTPSTKSEESNPSVEVHRRKEGWGGGVQHGAKA